MAAALLERITDRTINAGERLPPEIELARQFGVHRGTVREALRELETNGVLKRERGSKLMMVTRPARDDVAAGVSRALPLHDVSYHDVWEALMALEPPIAAAAARERKAADLHASTPWSRGLPKTSTPRCAVEQTADFFRAIGEATHNGVFMLAHEPLVQLLVPSLGAMIDKVPQARARIADAQKRLVAAIRDRDAAQAEEWMAKHIRDFRRGFEIAGIALERRVGATPRIRTMPGRRRRGLNELASMEILPRRDFMRKRRRRAAAPSPSCRATCSASPRHISPSDRVNIAAVGVGGMGRANMQALAQPEPRRHVRRGLELSSTRASPTSRKQIENAQKRVAEATDADAEGARAAADQGLAGSCRRRCPKSKRYTDYREMLAKQKNIDAVVIATPDHTHAHIALAAMDLGKHVYVQKPLAWSVEECRRLAKRATETKLQTQMGNQGHSSDDARLVNEYIQSGAIGTVTEVHVWTNRPLAYWPQGIPRPAPLPANAKDLPWNMNGVMTRAAGSFGTYAPPDKLAWDLFLGPVALRRLSPYLPPVQLARLDRLGRRRHRRHGRASHRFRRSGRWISISRPRVETTSTPYNHDTYPMASTTYYEFPAKGARPGREDDLVRRRPHAAEARGDGRRGIEQGRRRVVHRHQGQAAARHVWLQSAAAAEVAARQRRASRPKRTRASRPATR